jgi:hypothetical protein
MLRDLNAVLFFLSLGLLTSYFSKNMIIIMVVAMIGTNLLMSIRRLPKEGFEGNKKTDDTGVAPASAAEDETEATGAKPKLDYASTVEKAYDNLDKLLGSDALMKMGEQTQHLAERQANLMKTMEGMAPLVQKAGTMLEGLNVGGMGDMMEKMMGQLSGFDKNVEKAKI